MFLTDPDGRIIKIYYKDAKEETKSVIYKIDEEYKRDNKFLSDVYASIEYIQKSDIGKQLVENLVNSIQTLNFF